MRTDSRRITLIVRADDAPSRSWNDGASAPERMIFIKNLKVLHYLLSNGPEAATHDVARIIVDHAADGTESLELLAALPHEVTADVLLISDCAAFLSAVGRGGNRVMYRLSAENVDFYLRTHGIEHDADPSAFYTTSARFAAAAVDARLSTAG